MVFSFTMYSFKEQEKKSLYNMLLMFSPYNQRTIQNYYDLSHCCCVGSVRKVVFEDYMSTSACRDWINVHSYIVLIAGM